jgi:hypothetical protein
MKSPASRAIVTAGAMAGVLDITAALVSAYLQAGVPPLRVFQYIASGLLGADAFRGGLPVAALGLLLHFVIAFGAAAVFYAASRRLPVLVQKAVPAGVAYGVAVWAFMRFVVVPLSLVRQQPFRLRAAWVQIGIHMVCVGLPIALAVSRHTRRP